MAKGIQSEIAAGKNLFNLKNIEKGYVIDFNTGRALQNASYFISDYIKVTPGDQYTKQGFTSSGEHWFYDKDKNPISNLGINSFTVPSNAKYVRLSGAVGSESKCMLEKGSTPTAYEPFIPSNLMLNNMLSDMEESVLYIGLNDNLDDCEDIYKKYQWNTNQQPQNAPFTEGGVVYIKYGFGSGGIIQFACKYNMPDVYIRVKHTTWSSWKKIACS